MISNTFGAPFGGTTEGGQYGLESLAVSLITPPNLGGSGGSCLPSIVNVAPGEPGVPVICWAAAFGASDMHRRILVDDRQLAILITMRSPRPEADEISPSWSLEGSPRRSMRIRHVTRAGFSSERM